MIICIILASKKNMKLLVKEDCDSNEEAYTETGEFS